MKRDRAHIAELRCVLQEARGLLAAVISTARIMVGGPVPVMTCLLAKIDIVLELTADCDMK